MRRWRNLTARRGRRFDPFFAAAAPPSGLAPPFREQSQRRGLVRRGGRFLAVPSTTPLPEAVWAPEFLSPARPRLVDARARGRRWFAGPPAAAAVPGFLASGRPPALPVRRGRVFGVPPAPPPQAGPGPLAPAVRRVRRPQVPGRGGAWFAPPWQPAAPPSWSPDPLRSRSQPAVGLRRRGQFWMLVPAPAAVLSSIVPPRLARRRCVTLTGRRGEFLRLVPPAQVVELGFVCQELAGAVAPTSHAGTAGLESHAGTAAVESHAGAAVLESHGGTVTICGRT